MLAIALAATALLFRAERFADKARKALAFAPRAEKAEALFAASADIAFASCARFENAAAFARIAGSVPFSAASLNAAKLFAYFAKAAALAAIAE